MKTKTEVAAYMCEAVPTHAGFDVEHQITILHIYRDSDSRFWIRIGKSGGYYPCSTAKTHAAKAFFNFGSQRWRKLHKMYPVFDRKGVKRYCTVPA